jgi:hypothetical protein
MTDTIVAVSEQDQITAQCRAEYDAGLMYRHDREKAWQIIEDFYFNKTPKSLKSRFNVPVPIIPGFVETWTATMARHVTLNFEQQEEADYKACQKVTALYQAQKEKDDYDWDLIDSDGKKLAALSGRSIYEYYAESKPKYKSNLSPVDHYDFYCDPMGGGNLENHRFLGRDNIFLSREELKKGVEAGLYDAAAVSKLINATKNDVIVDNDSMFRSKQNRLTALGLDGITHNYAGQALYKFIRAGTTYNGERKYVLFNHETGISIRTKPLKEVFESDLWWFTSWATNRDTFNFWSKGPCEDMLPLAEAMRVLVNQELDNRNKRNYGMRGYDPALIDDPAQLEWRPDGLVKFKSGSAQILGDMSKGLFNFETPQMSGTIELVNWIDGMLKEKTGVNSEAQGQSDQDKVGIAYLNVQQSAKRTALTYESYNKCWQAIGRRFLWGLFEHMRSPLAVKIIGEKGAEWDEIARREIKTDWNIRVEGSMEQIEQDEIKKKALTDIMATFADDELMVTSPKWRVKTKLQAAGVDDDEIRMAFDMEGDQNKEILAEASLMIQDCLAGRPVKPNRGATTGFVQKIVDYATDTDLKTEEYMKLMQLAEMHMPIAQENAVRKALTVRAQQGMPAMPPTDSPFPGAPPVEQPAANTPGGTASRSQQLTNQAPNVQRVPTAA